MIKAWSLCVIVINTYDGLSIMEETMKFEVGKYYKHASGNIMHVIGGLQTTLYGGCLVAEEVDSANLKPIGQDETSVENWLETTKEDFMQYYSK